MKYAVCLIAFVFCFELNAECVNGQCNLTKKVQTVAKGTVRTVRNVKKGAVRVVTPKKTCVNGKCYVK